VAARGQPARVVNYGESGYVIRQSVAMLLDRLEHGDRPSLVVFYGGTEDTFSALQNGEAGLPQNESNRRQEFNVMQPYRLDKTLHVMTSGIERLGSLIRARLPESRTERERTNADLAPNVATVYCRTAEIAEMLGRGYGFETRVYWQPVLFTKHRTTVYEAGVRGQYEYARDFFAAVDDRLGDTEACHRVGLRNISRVFDTDPEPAYLDAFHLTERGNALVAREVAPDLAVALATRTSGPSAREAAQ
jgi:hypothetical protein